MSHTIGLLAFMAQHGGGLHSVLDSMAVKAVHFSVQGIIGADYLHSRTGPGMQTAANVAVVIGVPLGIALAILALRQLNEARTARHTEITLRLFEIYQSDHMREVMDYMRKPELRNLQDRLDYDRLKEDREAERSFIDMGNYFELISVLASSHQWDPGAASKLFGDMLKHYWGVCEPAVLAYRQKPGFGNMWKPWEAYVKDQPGAQG